MDEPLVTVDPESPKTDSVSCCEPMSANCGVTLAPGQKFCVECGSPVDQLQLALAKVREQEAARGTWFAQQLRGMSKQDMSTFAEILGLDEDTVIDVAEDKESEEEAKDFLAQEILREIDIGGELYRQGIKQVKERAKSLGLSKDEIKEATSGAEDKKEAVLRLIFEKINKQAGITTAGVGGSGKNGACLSSRKEKVIALVRTRLYNMLEYSIVDLYATMVS